MKSKAPAARSSGGFDFHPEYVNSVGFSPNGKLVLAAARGRVVIVESPSPAGSGK
jgi:hypothetical protein